MLQLMIDIQTAREAYRRAWPYSYQYGGCGSRTSCVRDSISFIANAAVRAPLERALHGSCSSSMDFLACTASIGTLSCAALLTEANRS